MDPGGLLTMKRLTSGPGGDHHSCAFTGCGAVRSVIRCGSREGV